MSNSLFLVDESVQKGAIRRGERLKSGSPAEYVPTTPPKNPPLEQYQFPRSSRTDDVRRLIEGAAILFNDEVIRLLLVLCNGQVLNSKDLAKKASVAPGNASDDLNNLVKCGLLERRKVGKEVLNRLKVEPHNIYQLFNMLLSLAEGRKGKVGMLRKPKRL